MEITLHGKVSLVTGGNSGIGEAIARELAAAGSTVAINYVANADHARELANELGGFPVEADISDPGTVANMFSILDRELGSIDILVNNAGIDGPRATGWEASPDQWRRVLEINLLGSFYCSREALRRMVQRKSGVIVNMSSVHEIIPWSGYSAYTTSKAAMGMMTQTLAQEAAPYGVRVVAVGPGAVKTPINRSVWSDPIGMKDLLDKIPLGRLGEPKDIARMVVFLASDFASYVTGRTIFVDGGMTDYPDFSHGG